MNDAERCDIDTELKLKLKNERKLIDEYVFCFMNTTFSVIVLAKIIIFSMYDTYLVNLLLNFPIFYSLIFVKCSKGFNLEFVADFLNVF